MSKNKEKNERYILKGGVIKEEKIDESIDKRNKNEIRPASLFNFETLYERSINSNIKNEISMPLEQEYLMSEYKIIDNDNQIKKLEIENKILKNRQIENKKILNSHSKQSSNIFKINVPHNNYLIFKNINEREPIIIKKQKILVNHYNENALKIKNRADIFYGDDEKYYKKFYDNNKKPVWHLPDNSLRYLKINDGNNNEKMFFPLANMLLTKGNEVHIDKRNDDKILEMFYPDMNVKNKNQNKGEMGNINVEGNIEKTMECQNHSICQKPIQEEKYSRISDPYGWRVHPIKGEKIFHSGIDIAAPLGTPIYAILDGVVEDACYKGPNGNMVRINHGKNVEGKEIRTINIHMNEYFVKKGDIVKKGQKIGTVGSTGRYPNGKPSSTGPHLHFGISENKEYVNPSKYIGIYEKK
ncbi:M23 family metallopeptidase [bacterium]|nr:M23 family metallopeptidase [bacterium]